MADKTIGDLSSILGADLNSEDIVHIKRASSGTEFKCTLQEFLNGLVNAVGATVIAKLLDGIQLGDGSADRNIQFATDANLLWDESDDQFEFDKKISAPSLNTGQGDNELYDMNQNVKTNSNVQFRSVSGRRFTNSFHEVSTTQDAVFHALEDYIPTVGDKMMVSGALVYLDRIGVFSYAERETTARIRIWYLYLDVSAGSGATGSVVIDNGGGALDSISIAW